jgi:hypothetical protein
MRYDHLVTFKLPDSSLHMESFKTETAIPRTKEWNEFVKGKFGQRTDWIVLNSVTTED